MTAFRYRLLWTALAFSGCALAFGARIGLLFHIPGPSEEAEKLLAASLMRLDGARLYRDIFAHHGPLTFLIPDALGTFVTLDVAVLRIVVFFCYFSVAAAAAACVWRSGRSYGIALACGIVALAFLVYACPTWQGYAYRYQNLAGAALGLTFLAGPVANLAGNRSGGHALHFFLGALFASVLALNFSVAFSLALVGGLWLCTLPGRRFPACLRFLAGFAAVAAPIFLWLLLRSTPQSFWDLYIRFNTGPYAALFHPESEQNVALRWLSGPLSAAFRLWETRRAGLQDPLFLCMAFLVLASGACAASKRAALTAAGCVLAAFMANTKGEIGFGIGFATTAVALSALFAAMPAWTMPRWDKAFGVVQLLVITGCGLALSRMRLPDTQIGVGKDELERHSVAAQAARTQALTPEEVQAVRELPHEDRILVLPWPPSVYMALERLPSNPEFFLLPWQADDRGRTEGGFRSSLCGAIASKSAALIVLFPESHIGGRAFREFGRCEYEAVLAHYHKMPGSEHIWLR